MSEKNIPEMLVRLEKLTVKSGLSVILENINLVIKKGESLAITGGSGSGKTSLGKVLAGTLKNTAGLLQYYSSVKKIMVEQQDHFMSLSGRRSTYYGQRYENQGMENTPTTKEYLQKIAEKTNINNAEQAIDNVIRMMQIEHIRESKLLQLSNGERKRTQMAAALLQKPDLLVLDQPFVGLDARARENLTALLNKHMKSGISLVIICDPDQIPDQVSTVIELQSGKATQISPLAGYHPKVWENGQKQETTDSRFLDMLPASKELFSDIVKMKNVDVTIGEKEILKGIDWQVRSGEQWALLGHNGAGKTTLLSLITADNPQGYNNDLVLFDRKRGTGESIWDIKNKIGFVSPELHLYFQKGAGIFNTIPGLNQAHTKYDSLSCLDVIVSGYKNEIGFASAPTDMQRKTAEDWFPVLRLNHLKDRLFMQASLGEQRALLLARALIKSPLLLILDEPCQGLDRFQTNHFVTLLNEICTHLHTTLIYVTHLKNEIPACITKLLILKDGQVEYRGEYI